MHNITKLFLHAGFLVVFGCLAITANAQATYTVNTSADDETDGCNVNACTLREAVAAANASAGVDNVVIAQSVTAPIVLQLGEIPITDAVNIAPASTTALATVSGGNNSRVFNVTTPVNTTSFNRLIVTNGYSPSADGGGIINNAGTLNITDSIISDNDAQANTGGGIYNNGGTVNILRSTIGGTRQGGSNIAGSGAGIGNRNGAVNLNNSTVSGNFANSGFGGGYYGFAAVELNNPIPSATLRARSATIANNFAPSGGGIAATSSVGVVTANIGNTIVGKNRANPTGPDLLVGGVGAITSAGFNLIENTSDGNFTPAAGDRTPQDPRLLPLANYGGLTPTHALMNSSSGRSEAIDRGSSTVGETTTDQRGFAIYNDPNSPESSAPNDPKDIGSFEAQAQAPTAASVLLGGRIFSSTGRAVSGARVRLIEANGTVRYAQTNGFGYYRFEALSVGQTVALEVSSKRYEFAPLVVTVNEELTNLNFTAEK